MQYKIIKSPTVGEFIAFLQQFPADAPLRIKDPDTSWTIKDIHVYTGEEPTPDIVWLTGDYSEMEQ